MEKLNIVSNLVKELNEKNKNHEALDDCKKDENIK